MNENSSTKVNKIYMKAKYVPTTSSIFGTRKAEVLNSLIMNMTAKADDTNDILQMLR